MLLAFAALSGQAGAIRLPRLPLHPAPAPLIPLHVLEHNWALETLATEMARQHQEAQNLVDVLRQMPIVSLGPAPLVTLEVFESMHTPTAW